MIYHLLILTFDYIYKANLFNIFYLHMVKSALVCPLRITWLYFADAEHLRTDVISSAGVCLGLVLIKITNLQILDPIIALIVAVIIFIAGAKICNQTKNNLLDISLFAIIVSSIFFFIPE